MENKQIVISTKTILITLGLIALAWILYSMIDLLFLLFTALVLSLALDPFVDKLAKGKITRTFAVVITVGILFVSLGILGSLFISPLILQTKLLIAQMPTYIQFLAENTPIGTLFNSSINGNYFNQITQSAGNVIQFTTTAFNSVFNIFVVFILTVYLLLDLSNVRLAFLSLFPSKDRKGIAEVLLKIEDKLGGWLRGQLSLMLIIGLLTYIGLIVLRIEESLALAVIAGLLEVVPIIGFMISLIIAVIIGFVTSPITGFAILGLYVLIQQLENNYIVPKVMEKAVGFNPIVTLFVLLIGGKMFGLIGMLLAIPMSIVIFEAFKFIRRTE